MIILLYRHIVRQLPVKIMSLLIGASIWHFLSTTTLRDIRVTIPLVFYNVPVNQTIAAPETVTVNLRATRESLQYVQFESMAAHVNFSDLVPGKQRITLSHETLFLPNTIKLVHYYPSNLIVELI